jgi:SAM-dependent methyltransferase
MTNHDDYRSLLLQRALDEDTFLQLSLKGTISEALPYRQVTARPVEIRGRRVWQVAHFTQKQDITKNYDRAEVESHLGDLLALPFTSLQVRNSDETLTVQITKKGKVILHRERAAEAATPDLTHDTPKALPIPPDPADNFLQQIGFMTPDGRIKAELQGKFAQVNEFIKLVDHTGGLVAPAAAHPLHILDCGCGSAHLTFGLHHYLNDLRGITATVEGVDTNTDLMTKSNALAGSLQMGAGCFTAAPIADYTPTTPPDVVVALHACDTATDDALALGIRQGAGLIVAAPCCHHHLHRQLKGAPAPFGPVLRQGILKKRMADILTDTFRALLLRMHGYKTDVIEFVAAEHTDRNLMIRAIKRESGADAQVSSEYAALKAFWGVTPYLESALGGLPGA